FTAASPSGSDAGGGDEADRGALLVMATSSARADSTAMRETKAMTSDLTSHTLSRACASGRQRAPAPSGAFPGSRRRPFLDGFRQLFSSSGAASANGRSLVREASFL